MTTPTTPPTAADTGTGTRPTGSRGRDDGPSAVAARLGPPIVVGALVLTALVVVVAFVLPQTRYPTIADAGTAVPADLVTVVDGLEGCVAVHRGDGTSQQFCDEGWRFADAGWSDDGAVLLATFEPREPRPVDDGREGPQPVAPEDETLRLVSVDPATGEELGTEEVTGVAAYERYDQFMSVDATWSGADVGREVVVDGEVLLRLDGAAGLAVEQHAVSPSGEWVAVVDSYGRVMVAATDGSTGPVRFDVDDRWTDLSRSLRWQDGA